MKRENGGGCGGAHKLMIDSETKSEMRRLEDELSHTLNADSLAFSAITLT